MTGNHNGNGASSPSPVRVHVTAAHMRYDDAFRCMVEKAMLDAGLHNSVIESGAVTFDVGESGQGRLGTTVVTLPLPASVTLRMLQWESGREVAPFWFDVTVATLGYAAGGLSVPVAIGGAHDVRDDAGATKWRERVERFLVERKGVGR